MTSSIAPAVSTAPPRLCPPGMAHVGGVCIDRWEASLVTVDGAGGVARWPHWEPPLGDVRYEARSEQGITPQSLVTRHQAERACRNAGKRLCSLGEWRRACQGPDKRMYPYGAAEAPGRCNNGKPHLLTLFYGEDPRGWDMRAKHLCREPGFLAPAGAYDECVSDEGVYDLVGNLHEWVSDSVSRELFAELDRDNVPRSKQGYRPGNGVFAGGFFSNRAELGPGCLYTTIAHYPGYHDYSIGFRCCRDAGPNATKRPASGGTSHAPRR